MKSCHKGFPPEGSLYQHVYVVRYIGYSSSVSFSLPEAGFHVSNIAFSSWKTELVERSEDRNSFYFTLCFPEGFFSHVKILPNSIRTGIPPSYFFSQRKVKGVIWERIGDWEDAESVVAMHWAVNLVIDSVNYRNVKLISGENLVRLINVVLSVGQSFRSW